MDVSGTFVVSLNGKGQCWLSHGIHAEGQPCIEECESFLKASLKLKG
jgi:hypothetical protein